MRHSLNQIRNHLYLSNGLWSKRIRCGCGGGENSFITYFPLFCLDFYFYFFFLSHSVRSNENAGNKLLKQLSKINRPLEIEFKEMLKLMNQCDIVEKQNMKRNERRYAKPTDEDVSRASFQFKNNPFSVFSGIIPGTKWCGTGDIAATYSDLGKWDFSFIRFIRFIWIFCSFVCLLVCLYTFV